MSRFIPAIGYLLKVTNKCNLNCTICPLKDKSELLLDNIYKSISAIKSSSEIFLCGAEPFVRKDILILLREMKNRGINTGIVTNGRIFIYREIAQQISFYINTIVINLFLPNNALYKKITNSADGFSQSINGIVNLINNNKNLKVELRYHINNQTIKHIKDTYPLIKNKKISRNAYIVFILSDIIREDGDIPLKTLLKYEQFFNQLQQEIDICFENLPYCIFPSLYHLDNNRFQNVNENDILCPFIYKKIEYKKSLSCLECIYESRCNGFPSFFNKKAIEAYIKPTKGVRSNSFDYIKIKEKVDIEEPSKNCKIYRRYYFDNPENYLYLKTDNGISLYSTDTNSFSREDIKKTKIERQQLYLDISNKITLNDFQKDIRQLRLNNICERCKQHNNCAGFFEISEGIPFEREERWLRQEIKRLVGRVLDIGCGDMRFYKDIINNLLERDIIEYYGIDIDEKALNKLKNDIPKAKIIKSTIEEFKFKEGYFDYIFSLRSLNHFFDMKRAFDNILYLTKNYGMIIIAESVPFALLRVPDQIKKIRRSIKPIFEHYRNWSSEEFLQFIRENRYPFKLDTHKPVKAGTSNQWITKLMKITL